MKVHKIFKVLHDISTDGRPCPIYKTRYAASQEVADQIAGKDWGSWGQTGHVEEVSFVVFENIEEAEQDNEELQRCIFP
jgi:hypothetical protein